MNVIVLVLLICFSTALMGAAIHRSSEKEDKHFFQKVWFIVFPLYCISTILTVVSVMIPAAPILLEGLRDVFISCYIYSAMLFGIMLYFNDGVKEYDTSGANT